MPFSAAIASREIIVGLHDLMAKRSSPQGKLDHVVDLIAEAMKSEVCSIYVARDGKLELLATHGLRKEAVHVTRLAPGEGLVGTIAAEARILNLAEASSHPAFAYRPETGEESFHSFAGVPIVHRENSIGVLAVQHADPRCYEEVEIEALQTVAMVLSELIASARLSDGSRATQRPAGAQRITGLKLVAGMARGVAVFHQPRVMVEHTVAEDTEAERARAFPIKPRILRAVVPSCECAYSHEGTTARRKRRRVWAASRVWVLTLPTRFWSSGLHTLLLPDRGRGSCTRRARRLR